MEELEGGCNLIALLKQIFRQMPEKEGKESAGVTPKERRESDSAATEDPQLIKQRRYELGAARMPDGHDEHGVLRVFVGGVPRREHGKSVGHCSPGAGIIIRERNRFEIGAGEAL